MNDKVFRVNLLDYLNGEQSLSVKIDLSAAYYGSDRKDARDGLMRSIIRGIMRSDEASIEKKLLSFSTQNNPTVANDSVGFVITIKPLHAGDKEYHFRNAATPLIGYEITCVRPGEGGGYRGSILLAIPADNAHRALVYDKPHGYLGSREFVKWLRDGFGAVQYKEKPAAVKPHPFVGRTVYAILNRSFDQVASRKREVHDILCAVGPDGELDYGSAEMFFSTKSKAEKYWLEKHNSADIMLKCEIIKVRE